MANPFETLKAQDLGFPEFPIAAVPRIRGSVTPWIPGMKATGTSDYYFVLMNSDIGAHLKAGGDPSRVLAHYLTYDAGVIAPLWGKDSFLERVGRMKAMGLKYLVAPDFSSWANMPVIAQLHNYYKSMVVSCDLVQAGFEVIPNICWSAPQIAHLSIGMWPPSPPTAVVDGAHVHTVYTGFNEELFWHGATMFMRAIKPALTLLWARSETVPTLWRKKVGRQAMQWVPTRNNALDALSKIKRSFVEVGATQVSG